MSITRDEFLQMQKERQERMAAPKTFGPRVNYFSLKDDGQEAIVRFVDDNPDLIPIYATHNATIDGKFRKIACLKPDRCPLCESGQVPQFKIYVKLIEYVRNDDGSISAQPKIWERSAKFGDVLMSRCLEYGNLSDNVFKIKRNGARGDMKTTYDVLFANPTVYNAQLYPKDFSAFDNYNVLGGPLMNMDATKMAELVGDAATVEPTPAPTVATDPLPQFGNQPTQPAGAQRRITY